MLVSQAYLIPRDVRDAVNLYISEQCDVPYISTSIAIGDIRNRVPSAEVVSTYVLAEYVAIRAIEAGIIVRLDEREVQPHLV